MISRVQSPAGPGLDPMREKGVLTPAMKIFVVNPNITRSMTESNRHGRAARRLPRARTIVAGNPVMGPASIEGYYDEAFSVPGPNPGDH